MAASKSKTPQEIKAAEDAKAAAKATVNANKAAHAAKLDTPDPALVAAAEAARADDAEKKDDEADKATGDDENVNSEPKAGEGSYGALIARIETLEIKVVELTEENERIVKSLRTGGGKVDKRVGTHVGSIDELGKI